MKNYFLPDNSILSSFSFCVVFARSCDNAACQHSALTTMRFSKISPKVANAEIAETRRQKQHQWPKATAMTIPRQLTNPLSVRWVFPSFSFSKILCPTVLFVHHPSPYHEHDVRICNYSVDIVISDSYPWGRTVTFFCMWFMAAHSPEWHVLATGASFLW